MQNGFSVTPGYEELRQEETEASVLFTNLLDKIGYLDMSWVLGD